MEKFNASHHAGYLLKVVQHEMRNNMDTGLKKIDLTTPQYATLSVLDEFPGISNAELARKCFVTAQTMNLIVKKLELRNLILREESSTHGRIQNIKLTESGYITLKKGHVIVFDIEDKLFQDLTDEELASLNQILEKVKK